MLTSTGIKNFCRQETQCSKNNLVIAKNWGLGGSSWNLETTWSFKRVMKHWSKLPKNTAQSPFLKCSRLLEKRAQFQAACSKFFLMLLLSDHFLLRRWEKLLTQMGLRCTFQRLSLPRQSYWVCPAVRALLWGKKMFVLKLLFSQFTFPRWPSLKS